LPLKPPPLSLSSIALTTKTIAVTSLYRVSRYTSGEPYFGRTALNRFDDRSRPKKARFGTCYCGLDLETAVAETMLHDLMPVKGRFSVPFNEFESRQLVRFSGSSLFRGEAPGPARAAPLQRARVRSRASRCDRVRVRVRPATQ
jgi:hypothetical protein